MNVKLINVVGCETFVHAVYIQAGRIFAEG